MADEYTIRIPDGEKAIVGTLRALRDEDFSRLLKLAREASPRLKVRSFSKMIEEAWGENLPEGLRGIIEMAVRASRAADVQRISSSEVLNALLEPLEENAKEGDPLSNETLRSRIVQLITVDSVRITAAAPAFLTAHPYVYTDAQIFSDLRPIFLQEMGSIAPPSASVIAHQLRIGVHHQDADTFLYVALDDADLLDLRDLIDAAIKRAAVLNSQEEISNRTIIRN
jgi:hypothetical protein